MPDSSSPTLKTTEVTPNRTCKPITSSTPLISVIIPVYNVAKLLERCVNSILTQTYHNLEIILVDDGSTDMSGKFCDVFAKKDSRIKVIHQENRGLSGARNSALNIVTGDFIIFIDGDDDVHPDLISRLYDLCREYDAEIAICSFQELPSDAPTPTALPATAPAPSDALAMSPLGALTAMLCEVDFSMSACGKLYARHLFNHDPFAPSARLRFPEGMLHEDVGTTYKLILNSESTVFTPEKLYHYRQNPASITKQSFSSRKLDLITLTDEMCANLETWAKEQPPATQSQIQNLTKKRRAHARFSILRQMILINPRTLPEAAPENHLAAPAKPSESPKNLNQDQGQDRASFLRTRREIVKYLRRHKNDILRNPLASRRDRLAMLSLLAGLPAFKRAWLTYQNRKTKK